MRILEGDELHDYLVELEYHKDEEFQVGDKIYKDNHDDIVDFIRTYSSDSFSQVNNTIAAYLKHGFISEVKVK